MNEPLRGAIAGIIFANLYLKLLIKDFDYNVINLFLLVIVSICLIVGLFSFLSSIALVVEDY